MELRQIRHFLGVARILHVTRAAQQLNVSQPALSASIKALEEELQTPLFRRLGRRIELTQAGQALLPYAGKMLQAAEEGRVAVQEVVGLLRGHLTVGVLHSLNAYLVPPLLGRFRALVPGVAMLVRGMHAADVPDGIVQAKLDLGITMLPVQRPDLVELPLFEEELVLVSPPPRSSRRAGALALREAASLPLVLFPTEYTLRRVIDQAFAAAGIELVPAIELADLGGIVSTVQNGVASTLLPLPYVRFMGLDERLPVRRLRDPKPARKVGIVYRKDRHQDPATRAFLQALKEVVAEQKLRRA
ncbi:MAG TPA: LysR substrate-binding domain-containing protein [Acidobacteriota bacterium]